VGAVSRNQNIVTEVDHFLTRRIPEGSSGRRKPLNEKAECQDQDLWGFSVRIVINLVAGHEWQFITEGAAVQKKGPITDFVDDRL